MKLQRITPHSLFGRYSLHSNFDTDVGSSRAASPGEMAQQHKVALGMALTREAHPRQSSGSPVGCELAVGIKLVGRRTTRQQQAHALELAMRGGKV